MWSEWEPVMLKAKITFDQKPGINLHSLHSKAEGWEGKNVVFWVMDEASAFRTANGVDNADTVYQSLRSSAQSRFAWMHWMGFTISFPRKQTGDFTLKKYELSKTNPNIYGDRGCTWEINPRWEKGHPMYQAHSDQWVIIEDLNVRVPKEFEEDFTTDGTDAMTRYMAQPPLTEGGFFENPVTIKEAVNRDLQPIIAEVGLREQELEHGGTRRYVTRTIISLPPVVEGAEYFMHGDPGLKQDAFCLAVAHTLPESKTVNETATKTVDIKRTVVDFVLPWTPRTNRPVDLLNVDDVILQLCRHYNIRQVTFDRWNSANSIQKIVAEGIDAEDMSFSNPEQLAMYRFLRLSFYNDMIELAPGDEDT